MFEIKGKRYIEWQDIQSRCQEILKNCAYNNKTYDAVVGIARGGMVPATILSYGLNTPLKMILVSSFEEGERRSIKDKTDPETKAYIQSHKVLVTDDIYDTGQTYDYVVKTYPKCEFIPLFDKRLEDPENKFWYVFPWDKEFNEKVR